MKKTLSCSTILLLYAFLVGKASAQCATNGCTICNDTDLVCEGLDSVPPLEDIFGWYNIERISLTNGAISEIPVGYFNLSSLESIDLSSNRLTTFKMDSLAYATSLREIDLTDNLIDCDSNIDWLRKWKTFFGDGNSVSGSCTDSGVDINTYLSEKPANLVAVKFYNSTVHLDRACSEVTLPFVIVGNFTSDLEYRATTRVLSKSAQIHVVDEYITVPVGTSSSEVNIEVTNRGENREDVVILLLVHPKYPVSYERQVEVQLLNGASGCAAPVPVIVATTPTPAVTQGVTTKPIMPTKDDSKTMPPKVSTEPTPTSGPGTMKPKPTPAPRRFPVWVIIVVILLVIVVGAVWFIYKKFNKENKTADNNPVGYEVVKGSDGKVYSDTTAEV